MVKRSLKASVTGIQQAKRAFARLGWTQENLASVVNLKTRQPIWRFFSGRPVDRHIFLEVCSVLELNWQEIAADPPAEFSERGELTSVQSPDIDALVQIVRKQRFDKIQDQCGILQLLDISRPVSIDDIYIDVNILEEIASLQWLEISDLPQLGREEFDRFGLGEVDQKQIPGMEAVETYSKLRVLGKPGVGKTTFLQHLAIQCNRGAFAANQVPIFITLRNFAQSSFSGEFSLLNYIRSEFLTSGIFDPSIIETLLGAGRVLLLLDGMDEVLNQQSNAVLREIRRFSDNYYKNMFVATCRTAGQKLRLRGFTDVEQYIGEYISNLTNATIHPEELQQMSEAALKAIEAQHGLLAERARGVFSFSYLAFQEYFTARKIVASHNLEALEQALSGLVSHITDPHWREIFLLTAAMLRSADSLVQLMKQQIDALVACDPYLQQFLTWASQKSKDTRSLHVATLRAFYVALARTPHTVSHFALASTLDRGMFLDAALDNLLLSCAIDHSQDFAHQKACGDALTNILVIVLDAGFYKSLQQLLDQFPNPNQNRERFEIWWQTQYSAWAEQLKTTIKNYRNIHHQWQFSSEQQQVLQRYYDANQLLVDCLNSNCEVTAAIREEIEATLLLPQKELEDREWQ